MRKIFSTTGKFHWLTDASGEPVKGEWPAWDVAVDAKYELRPAPHQPLVLDICGWELFASSQCTYRLVLDNGVVLTGRAGGGGTFGPGEPPRERKVRMFDVDQRQMELHPNEATDVAPQIDSAIFGIVSSRPFGIGHGFASPSKPFTYTQNPKTLKRLTTEASRLRHGGLEVTVVGTSRYWRKLVDTRMIQHRSIVGVRPEGGGLLPWKDLYDFTYLLTNFLGWLNHCAAPVFHVKGYRGGRLVYRGYDLHPHATVQRDSFSWFPEGGVRGGIEAQGDVYAELMQDLLDGFATVWEESRKNRGTFHIALQLLRGESKGGPQSAPSVGYLRDTFTACAILERMLTGKSDESGRQAQIARCLEAIEVEDRLPGLQREQLDFAVRERPQMWWAKKQQRVVEDERAQATMSRPLANVDNWLLHLEDPQNAQRLLDLGTPVQQYLVNVSIWLADLMLMKIVGYNGWYFSRLSMEAEKVPWVP